MSRRTMALAGAVLVLAAGFVASRRLGDDSSGAGTARVARGDFRVVVEATGRLEAAVAYEIGPPSVSDVWEYSLAWMIPEGRWVDQGTVVARFDATSIDDRLRDYRARLETTSQEREKEQRNLEISLRQLRLDLVKAEGELNTVGLELSLPEGLAPPLDVQQARLKKGLAQRRVVFLKEKIEFEQELVTSKLDLLAVKKDYAEGKITYLEAIKETFSVRAPVSGLVIYVPKRNGGRYEVGESVWMMAKIMRIADVSTLRVEAQVLEADAARISGGQAARISVDAVPGMTLVSEVTDIGRIVRERSQQDPSKVFDVIFPLEDFDREVLRPGMSVTVEVETQRLADRLTIPFEAVHTSPEGTFVEVVGRGGRLERRQVELGERGRGRVVVEAGLVEGEPVHLYRRGGRT